MPWLTPDSIPEGDDCRPLLIPADSAWLALVSGALTELTLKYNWEKFGTLTVDETVAKMQEIVDGYYNTPCAACTVPGGYPVVRININGHLEELGADGTWQTATGDYLIPPPTARTEGTTPDQNCLAAKNATNVLFTLYSSLSNSFAHELSADEALVAFISAAIAAIGFEFAPITFAIAAVGFVIFEALFSALQYVTADLWTDAFTQQFTCLLLNCVNNTAGVVTFDWDCFNNALLAQVNPGGLSEVTMRLYLQIGYLLYFIGGADGLNLAARTTAIDNDDCSFCEIEHCFLVDFKVENGSAYGVTIEGSSTWVLGTGLVAAFAGGIEYDLTVYWPFGFTVEATSIEMVYTKTTGSGTDNQNHLNALNPASNYATSLIAQDAGDTQGTDITKSLAVNATLAGIGVDINSGAGGSTAAIISAFRVRYTGDIPDGWSDNCS